MRIENFWCSLLTGKQIKLSCTLYRLIKLMHDDADNAFNCRWIQNVKSILDRSGFGECWDKQEMLDVTWLKRTLDLRLKDIYMQVSHSDVNVNSQCVNYRIFKESSVLESYFYKCGREDSRNLCKFRCGSHRLPIVSGRCEELSRSSRLCTLCSADLIGDEFHYIIIPMRVLFRGTENLYSKEIHN